MSTAGDLTEVLEDQLNYKIGLMGLNVEEDAIFTATDLDFPAFQTVFRQVREVVESNFACGMESTVFFFYGGHGVMDYTTYAVCTHFDQQRPYEWKFPIEREIR